VIVGVVFLGVFLYFSDPPELVEVSHGPVTMELTSIMTGKPEAILADELQITAATETNGHGCFKTQMSLPMLTETYQIYEAATPLAPKAGLDCYDADMILNDLNADIALPFLARANVADGLDRVIVVYDDGRAFVWNQPNNIPNNINE